MQETSKRKMDTKGANFWTAVTLIFIGFLFLLNNFDIIDLGDLWEYWPLIFIIAGLIKLKSSGLQDRSSAMFLITFGVLFLLLSKDFLDWDIIWQLWPIILILIGLSIIYRRKTVFSRKEQQSEDRIDVVAVFGGNNRVVTSDKFKGGSITAIFGGAKLDFGRASLDEGKIILDVFSMFGGAEIRIPKEWHLELKGVPIFGGFEDSRSNLPAEEKVSDRSLVLKGLVLFGGLEIKDA